MIASFLHRQESRKSNELVFLSSSGLIRRLRGNDGGAWGYKNDACWYIKTQHLNAPRANRYLSARRQIDIGVYGRTLEPVLDLAVLVDTALKMASKYSFISNKIRFFGHFRLVSSAFAEIVNRFLKMRARKCWLT